MTAADCAIMNDSFVGLTVSSVSLTEDGACLTFTDGTRLSFQRCVIDAGPWARINRAGRTR